MKVLYLKDVNKYVLTIERNYCTNMYRINGNIINVEYGTKPFEIVLDSLPVVTKIINNNIITHYESDEGTMTVDDFEVMLTLKGGSEVAVNSFVKKWCAIVKTIITESEPLPYQLFENRLDTGNQYISSLWTLEGEISSYAKYDRPKAVIDIFRRICEENGLKENQTYILPNHSSLEYAQVCGKYIFNSSWDVKYSYRDELGKCLAQYERDETEIRNRILVQLAISRDNKLSISSLSSLQKCINDIISSLTKVESKQATMKNYQEAMSLARKLKSAFEDAITKE